MTPVATRVANALYYRVDVRVRHHGGCQELDELQPNIQAAAQRDITAVIEEIEEELCVWIPPARGTEAVREAADELDDYAAYMSGRADRLWRPLLRRRTRQRAQLAARAAATIRDRMGWE